MPRLSVDPPVRTSVATATFLQTITASDKGKPVGRAVWASSPTQPGAVQIVALEVHPDRARQGMGSLLMTRLFDEANQRARNFNTPLRRIWIVIEQKTQIVSRGFLTRHGFHHVKTLDALLKDEAAMVYVKSFD